MNIIIENGLICTATDHFVGDIVITGDTITAITAPHAARQTVGSGTNNSPAEQEFQTVVPIKDQGTDYEIIDATGHYVVPGGIDPHTHFDLQQSPKHRACDDFLHGGIAAPCGGTTTIIDHIAFGPAGCSLHHQFDVYRDLAKDCPVDYSFHGVFQHVDDSILKEINELVTKKGFPSFKAYTTYGSPMHEPELFALLERLKKCGGLLTVHAEDDTITNTLRNRLTKEELLPIGHALTRPNTAESISVNTVIGLARVVGDAPVYLVHMSAHESLSEIRLARQEGQANIYAETCPQYLFLTDDKFKDGGPMESIKYMLAPPLRKKEDQDALWQGLQDGTVQVVATDHCPFTIAEKQAYVDDFRNCPGGISGVEERMPLLFSEGVLQKRLTPEQFVQVTATNAARIFGITNKGDIKVGYDADLVLFNPNESRTFRADNLKTTCGYSAYEGMTVNATVAKVFLRGQLIAENNTFCGKKGYGQLLKRHIKAADK